MRHTNKRPTDDVEKCYDNFFVDNVEILTASYNGENGNK